MGKTRGKNGRQKSIVYKYNGTEYELDSGEEYCFFAYLVELERLGMINSFEYQPDSLALSERFTYIPILDAKGREKFLYHPHVYTADFRFTIQTDNVRLLEYFSQAFKLDKQSVTNSGTLDIWVDVKGGFMSNDGGRSFSINQKLVYEHYRIIINKIVPSKDFKKLGVPPEAAYTPKTKKPVKAFAGLNYVETQLKAFGLLPEK